MFPEPKEELVKEWILPRWAYLDKEWDEFTFEETQQGYRFVNVVVTTPVFNIVDEDDII